MSNLVKTFNISKNTDLTSKDGLQSNASNIVTASNWFNAHIILRISTSLKSKDFCLDFTDKIYGQIFLISEN